MGEQPRQGRGLHYKRPTTGWEFALRSPLALFS
jgi:hypothetical protein